MVRIVRTNVDVAPSQAIQELKLPRTQRMCLFLGQARALDLHIKPHMEKLSQAVSDIAANNGALLVHGGVNTDIIRHNAFARELKGNSYPVLCVAPESKVRLAGAPLDTESNARPLDPNISHALLIASGEGASNEEEVWRVNTGYMFRTVGELNKERPASAFIIGGGIHTSEETLKALQLGIKTFVFEGSGGFADTLAKTLEHGLQDGTPSERFLPNIMEHRDLISVMKMNNTGEISKYLDNTK